MSIGSLCSDMGDTWYHEPPTSPRWAGALDWLRKIIVKIRRQRNLMYWAGGWEEQARDFISEVRESSLWAPLCDCLTPADVPVLRTAGSKWYDAKLWFFLMKTKGTDVSPPVLSPECTNLWHFGFGLFEPGRLLDLTAFTSSGERT